MSERFEQFGPGDLSKREDDYSFFVEQNKKYKEKIAELEKQIAELDKQIAEKEIEIAKKEKEAEKEIAISESERIAMEKEIITNERIKMEKEISWLRNDLQETTSKAITNLMKLELTDGLFREDDPNNKKGNA